METIKTKSAAKIVVTKSPYLENAILSTMKVISKIVGGTLGPGGHPVLLERQEYNLPPLVTKDGVTVFRSLGFENPIQQSLLEAARDASVRTAQEAGDGTTTATILSEAFVRYTTEFCKANPTIPPIRVIKTIQKLHQEIIAPTIKKLTLDCDLESKEGLARLRSVAKLSANGDEELADAVMQCFDITGDAGNVTIVESSGQTSVEVERIEGYPMESGYEESCAKFYPVFINEPATQRVVLEKPLFLLYFGKLVDIQTALDILSRLQDAFAGNYLDAHNIVLMATGFSESVLANLASFWINGNNINVFPLVINKTAVLNSERNFLEDVAAVTGAKIFDPLTAPLSEAQFLELGNCKSEMQKGETVYVAGGIKSFECGRYRSTIIGRADEEATLRQIQVVEAAVKAAESEYDQRYQQERLAKLSGGIAKLKVVGASNGELKERRDRAEDAVCAVRGAIKHGALVGGGWTIVNIVKDLKEADLDESSKAIVDTILEPSLLTTCQVLFSNAGLDYGQQDNEVLKSIKSGKPQKAVVVDVSTGATVNAIKAGILDSAPALSEAIKNAISIATLLGTLGGTVVFPRDKDFEIKDARDAAEFKRMSEFNMADERNS